jgi:hypothetical protein
MASRKALVLVAGEIQQLQAGDTLAGPVSEVGLQSLTNSDAASTAIGDVMYIFGADSVKKCKADAVGTSQAACIATAVITAAGTGNFQFDGVLGGLSGLVAGTTYYLSAATAGLLTSTAPSTVGQCVTRIGIALSTTELDINIQRFILL